MGFSQAYETYSVCEAMGWRVSREDLANNVKLKKTRAKVSKWKKKMREAQLELREFYPDSELEIPHIEAAMNFDIDGWKPFMLVRELDPQSTPGQ